MNHMPPTLSRQDYARGAVWSQQTSTARALRRALKTAALERERSMGGPETAYWTLTDLVNDIIDQLEGRTWPDVS